MQRLVTELPAESSERWLAAAVVGGIGVFVLASAGLMVGAPDHFGLLLCFGAVSVLGVVIGLRRPVVACIYLLIATFFRLAIPSGTLPVDPFLLAFAGVLASMWIWTRAQPARLLTSRIDPVSGAIALYVGWNVVSMLLPHPYPPGAPLDPVPFSVERFIVIGTMMPLVMFLVARRLLVTRDAVRPLIWTILGTAAYSAMVSIFQFVAPALVWPRYILHNTFWPGRAVGVFNQPVVNGLALIVGFLVAVLVASHAAESVMVRIGAAGIAVANVVALYLTHTRAVWLSFALVVLVGALVAKGFRTGFVLTMTAIVGAIAGNWSVFTSADRSSGGVGSPDEVLDRLNSYATSVWAFEQRPLMGWGIGRFAAVNTYHHQQYSPAVPWQRGFGIPSHLDALGILVELGVIGLAFWLLTYVLIYAKLVRASTQLPSGDMYGRALSLTALLCLVAQTTTGLTVDLRFFDFPNIIVLVMAGAAIGLHRAHTHPRSAGQPVGSGTPLRPRRPVPAT